MKKERSKLSTFVLGSIFVIMLAAVIISFLRGNPPYTITDGMVYVLGLIILLLISDSIETFSIGSLITLKKKVDEKEKEVYSLSSENRELRTQLTSIVTTSLNNQNSNANATIIDLGNSLRNMFKVELATEDDSKQESKIEQELLDSTTHVNAPDRDRISPQDRHKFLQKLDSKLFSKFIEQNNLNSLAVHRQVKFSDQFIGSDPIIERQMIFDGYIKRPLDEIFIETLMPSASVIAEYRLYYMISKIYHYSNAKKTPAKLVLVVPLLPKEQQEKWLGESTYRNPERNLIRIKELFAPALNNNLLEIVEMEFSDDDWQEITQPSSNTNK